MTTLSHDAPRVAQRPRVHSAPSYVSSSGREAVELAASAGLYLDHWQQLVLEDGLGERADGQWSAFEVGLIVSRQNGKGAILEARELAGLFLFGERLILHSAHEFKTAQEAFRRVVALVTNMDSLRRQVKRIPTSHGEEGIELINGQRLRFVARSGGSGRGFSGDCVILDEAMILGAQSMAALLPTLSARPNPQLWYTASAGLEGSEQLRRVRARGMAGTDPGLAYFEWSAHDEADLDDRDAWAAANPALGIRVSEEFVARERNAMPDPEFARERLGIWSDARREAVIDPVVWDRLCDKASQALDPVCFAVDVTPDRSAAAIAMAGRRSDGRFHVELVDHRPGTSWVAERLSALRAKWSPSGIYVDPAGPAGSLLGEMDTAHVPVESLTTREVAQACGAFYDAATQDGLRHIGQPKLAAALLAAKKRPLGDAWAWARKDTTDISPLVAATIAIHGVGLGASCYEDRGMLII